MTSETWKRVKEIVANALEREPAARAAFVREACGGDSELQAEAESLLRAEDQLSGEGTDDTFLRFDATLERIGAYKVVRELGSGGMGTVYLAERDDGQFEQRVAIKVVKRGMDTGAVLERFRHERRLLARLDHPNITRIFDGGVVDGRPFFVMDYFEGRPVDEYCQEENLTVARRLAVFLQICDAVGHAHQNLILHRDIKPANVIVDHAGTPHLLDFGIAKVIEGDGVTEQTQLGPRALTPHYASPEQTEGAPLTTASDVYSLGLLLFEMLTGKRARDAGGVLKPSANCAGGMVSQVRGDLDNITLKAVESDPARRYRTAAELSEDIERHLSARPVLARPGGAMYRAQKFLRRHRKSLAVAAVVLLCIGAALADAVYQQRRATRRFEDVRQLANSFLFEFHDAIAKLPGSTPARELVVNRALRYLDSLAKDSGNDEGLKRELGTSYMRVGDVQGSPFDPNLGKSKEARASYAAAFAIFDPLHSSHPADAQAALDLATVRLRMASLANASGDNAQSAALNRGTIALTEDFEHRKGLTPKLRLMQALAWFGLAESEMDSAPQEALKTRLRSVDLLKRAALLEPGDVEVERYLSQTEKRLAVQYMRTLHDTKRAAESLRASIGIDEARVARNGADGLARLDLALGHAYLAAVIRRQGDKDGARQLLSRAIAEREEMLSADPRNVRVRQLLMVDYERLGGWLREDGDAAAAGEAIRRGAELGGGRGGVQISR